MTDKDKVKKAHALLNEPVLSFEDRVRLANILSSLLDEKITPQTIFTSKADAKFMARFYPYDDYNPSPIASHDFGHSLASLVKGDVKSTLLEAMFHMTKKPESTKESFGKSKVETKEHVKNKIRNLIMKTRTGDETKELITLLNQHNLKTVVTEENYEAVAKRFMKTYFPKLTNQIPSQRADEIQADQASSQFG